MHVAVPSLAPSNEQKMVLTGYPNPHVYSCKFKDNPNFREDLLIALQGTKIMNSVDLNSSYELLKAHFGKQTIPRANICGSINSIGKLYCNNGMPSTLAPGATPAAIVGPPLKIDNLLNTTCMASTGMAGSPATSEINAKQTFFGILVAPAAYYTQIKACYIATIKNSRRYSWDYRSKVCDEVVRLKLSSHRMTAKDWNSLHYKELEDMQRWFRSEGFKTKEWRKWNHNIIISTESKVFVDLYLEYVLPHVQQQVEDLTQEQQQTLNHYVAKVCTNVYKKCQINQCCTLFNLH